MVAKELSKQLWVIAKSYIFELFNNYLLRRKGINVSSDCCTPGTV